MGSRYTDCYPGPPTHLYILYKSRCSHTLSWTSLRNGSHVVVQGFISYIFNSSLSGFPSVYTPILSAYRYVSGTYYDMYFLNSIAPIYRLPIEFMEPLKKYFPYFSLLLCITAVFCGVCLGCAMCLFPTTIIQQDAAVRIQFYFTAALLYMFPLLSTPIIRSTSTVSTASGTGHTSVQLPSSSVAKFQTRPRWRKIAAPMYDLYRRL